MPNPLCKGTFKGFLGSRQHSECVVEDGTHWPQVTLEPLNYDWGGERLLGVPREAVLPTLNIACHKLQTTVKQLAATLSLEN